MKRLLLVFGVTLLILVRFPVGTSAFNMPIVAEEATVANIYWEVQDKDRSTLSNGTKIDLVDSDGIIVATTLVADDAVFFENVPFGEYTVMVDNDRTKIIPVTINKDSLDTQHIKQIKLLEELPTESDTTKTGDNTNYYPVLGLLVSGIILAFYKFSYSKEV